MASNTTTNTANNTNDLTLPRKLTETEQTALKNQLAKCYKENTSNIDEEDMTDILDYTLTMIQNGKSVVYVTGELEAICESAALLQGLKDRLMGFVEGIVVNAAEGSAGVGVSEKDVEGDLAVAAEERPSSTQSSRRAVQQVRTVLAAAAAV